MEIKQIITATVAVILICLVAIPLIDVSAKNVELSENNSVQNYMMAGTGDDLRIEYVSTASYLVNGKSLTVTDDDRSKFYPIFFCDNLMVALGNTGGVYSPFNTAEPTSLKTSGDYVEFSNGTWTTSISGVTNSHTYEWLMVPNEQGDYGLFRFNTHNITVDNNATIYALCEIYSYSEGTTTNYSRSIVYGTVDDGLTGLAWAYVDSTIKDVTAESQFTLKLTGEKGEVSSTLKGVYGQWGNSTERQIYTVIAPIEYHYLDDNGKIIVDLLKIIPILLIAALLIGIGYSIMRRD